MDIPKVLNLSMDAITDMNIEQMVNRAWSCNVDPNLITKPISQVARVVIKGGVKEILKLKLSDAIMTLLKTNKMFVKYLLPVPTVSVEETLGAFIERQFPNTPKRALMNIPIIELIYMDRRDATKFNARKMKAAKDVRHRPIKNLVEDEEVTKEDFLNMKFKDFIVMVGLEVDANKMQPNNTNPYYAKLIEMTMRQIAEKLGANFELPSKVALAPVTYDSHMTKLNLADMTVAQITCAALTALGDPKVETDPCDGEAYDPVCGSDGLTYDSMCAFNEASCRANGSLTVQYTGVCVADTSYNSGCPTFCDNYLVVNGTETCQCAVEPTPGTPTVATTTAKPTTTKKSETTTKMPTTTTEKPTTTAAKTSTEKATTTQKPKEHQLSAQLQKR